MIQNAMKRKKIILSPAFEQLPLYFYKPEFYNFAIFTLFLV